MITALALALALATGQAYGDVPASNDAQSDVGELPALDAPGAYVQHGTLQVTGEDGKPALVAVEGGLYLSDDGLKRLVARWNADIEAANDAQKNAASLTAENAALKKATDEVAKEDESLRNHVVLIALISIAVAGAVGAGAGYVVGLHAGGK